MLVIAHYNESLEWLKEIKQPFIVYSKGENALGTDAINVPNEGREGDVWLRYIIEHYDKLDEMTIFLQGNPFEHFHFPVDAVNLFINTEYDYFLIGKMITNGMDIPGDLGDLKVVETYKRIFGTPNSVYRFAAGAQYAVNKKLITNKPLSWWKRLYEIYNDTPDNAHVFERLWIYIWKHEISNT